MPEPIDFKDTNLAALPWQWRDEVNIDKLVEILSSQTLSIQEDILLMFDIDDIDISDGELLDLIGAQVGRTRQIGEGDIEYRRGLVVQIMSNNNTGLASEIGAILDYILNRPSTEMVSPYDSGIAEVGVILKDVDEAIAIGHDTAIERYTAAGVGVCIQLGSVNGMFRLGGLINGTPTTPSPGKPLNTIADQTRGSFGTRCYKPGVNEGLVPFGFNGPGPLNGKGLSSVASSVGGQFQAAGELTDQFISDIPYTIHELLFPIFSENDKPILSENNELIYIG